METMTTTFLLTLTALLVASGPGLAQEDPAAGDPVAEGAAEATSEDEPATHGAMTSGEVEPDTAAMIASAESAAPPAIAKAAEVTIIDENGQMVALREGTNGWFCMPDDPGTGIEDPMCGNANTREWLMALIEQRDPPAGKVGMVFALHGSWVASNADPYAPAPENEADWIKTGPHVAIMNDPDVIAGYPHEPNPDTTRPFVMWYDSPFAHLMIPLE